MSGCPWPCGSIACGAIAQALHEAAQPLAYARGDWLVRQGDAPTAVGLVLSGRVKVVCQTDAGRSIIVKLLGPGEVFGTIPVLDGRCYPAGIEGQEPGVYGRVSAEAFQEILANQPGLAMQMLRSLSSRTRELTAAMVDQSAFEVDVRLARRLLEVAGSDAVAQVTRQELADLTGTTVETAIRITRRWQQSGLVQLSRGQIVLRNINDLRRVALLNSGSPLT
jgi:CRP-like cAMP-binding protein